MNLGKKGKKLTTSVVQSAILGIVIIIILFGVYAAMVPEAQTAGDSLNDTNRCTDVGCFYNSTRGALPGNLSCTANNVTVTDSTACASINEIPLSSLFGSTGIVFVILMAVLLIVVIIGVLKSAKGSK